MTTKENSEFLHRIYALLLAVSRDVSALKQRASAEGKAENGGRE